MKRDRIEECLKGRSQAVYGLVDEYRSLIAPLVFAVEGQSPLTDAGAIPHRMVDLASGAFIRILKGLAEAPSGPRFRSWARQRAFTELRGHTRLPSDPLDSHDGTRRAPLNESAESDKVRDAASRLAGDQRLVVWAVISEGLDLPSAADLLNVPIERVRELLDNSLAEVRQYVHGGGAGGEAVENEPDLRKLVYDRVDDRQRRAIEGSTTRYSSIQRRLDDLIKERQTLKRALQIDIPTSRILRELRGRHRISRFAISPGAWLAAQVAIVIAFIAAMATIGRDVPAADIGIRVVRGSVTSSTGVAPKPVPAAEVQEDGSLVRFRVPRHEDDPQGMHTLDPGETLTVDPYSSAVLRVEGPNDLRLGPDTVVRMETPTPAMPILLTVSRGVVWFDMRAFNRPVRLAVPTGQHVRIGPAEGLLEVRDGSVTITALEGRVDLTTADDPRAVTHVLRSGQAARFRVDDAGTRVGPEPVTEYAPPGFPLPTFEDPAEQKLAVSTEFIRRSRLDDDNTIRHRFHWLRRSEYPLALDRVPPAVQARLDEYYANFADVRREGDRLEKQVEIATLRLQEARRAMEDTRREIRLLTIELEAMAGKSEELRELREQAASLEQALQQKIDGTDDDGQPLFDPDGFRVFALQAKLEGFAARLRALRDLDIKRLAAQAVLDQMQPKYAAAEQQRDAAQRSVQQVQARIDRLTADLEAMAALDAQKAELELEQRNLTSAISALEERLAAAKTAQANARNQVQALQASAAQAEELAAAVTNAAEQLATAREQLQQANATLEQARAHATAANERVEQRRAALQTATEKAQAAADRAQDLHDKLKQAEAENQSASNELSRLSEAVEQADAALAAARETLARREAEWRDATAARDRAAAQLEEARAALAAAQAAKQQNAEQQAQLKATVTRLESSLPEVRTRRDELTAALEPLTARQRETQQALEAARVAVARQQEAVTAARATVAETGRALTAADAALEQARTALEAAREAQRAATAEKQAADAHLAEVRAGSDEGDPLYAVRLAMATLRVQMAEKQLADATTAVADANQQVEARTTAREQAAAADAAAREAVAAARAELESRNAARAQASQAAEAATQARSEASQQLEDVQDQLDRDTAALEQARAGLTARADAAAGLAERVTQAQAALESAAQAHAQAQSRATDAEKARTTAQSAVNERTADQTRAVEALEEARKRHGPVSESLQEARETYTAARQAADQARQQADAAAAAHREAVKAHEAAAEDVSAAEQQVATRQAAVNTATARHQEAVAAASEADADGVASRLAGARDALADQQQTVTRLEASLTQEQRKLATLEERTAALNRQLARKAELTAERETVMAEKAEAEQALAAAQQKLQEIAAEVEPKRQLVEQLEQRLAVRDDIEAARRQTLERIDEIRGFMLEVDNLRSRLQNARYRIVKMEEEAGAAVAADRRARLVRRRADLASQQEGERGLIAELEAARDAVRGFESGGRTQELAEYQTRLVEELLGMIGGYRGLSIRTSQARKILREAVERYAGWRQRVGPRMDDTRAAVSVERAWERFMVREVNRLMPSRAAAVAALSPASLLPPGQGLGTEAGSDGNHGDSDD